MTMNPDTSTHAADAARAAKETCCPSCFDAVWQQIASDPYLRLPTERVTLRSFFRGLRNRLLEAGRRTLRRQDDLLPQFDKLIRPNGICAAGTWEIERTTPYTGLLATGAKGLVVARASVAFAETRKGRLRSFGLAGKVYPTLDGSRTVQSANFFVIDDNGGTYTPHFADAVMTNKPPFTPHPGALAMAPVLLAITIAQRLSDSHSGIRQLYPLARAGLADPDEARAPQFLRVRGKPGPRAAAEDFRDELRASLEQGPLEFEVAVRDAESEEFQPVGTIRLTRALASRSCDHRLHFAHPRWESPARHVPG